MSMAKRRRNVSGHRKPATLVDRWHRVAERQRSELFAPINEECIAADYEPARSQLGQLCEDSIEVTFGVGIQDVKLQPKVTSRCPQLLHADFSNMGVGWIDEQSHDARRGDQLVQEV